MFRLAAELEEKLAPLGLRMQYDKSTSYSPRVDLTTCEHRPDGQFPRSVAIRAADGAEWIGKESKLRRPGDATDGEIIATGCVVAGVPIGDRDFVRVHLEETVTDAVSKTENITSMLSDHCLHALHTLNMRCLQPILCYWTQHCAPRDVELPARRMDSALVECAIATQGPFFSADGGDASQDAAAAVHDVSTRRLRLPARSKGGALRSLEDLAPVAFAATVAKIAPKLVRSTDAEGVVRKGFLETIAGEEFGVGHFDGDEHFDWGGEGRYAHFLRKTADGRHASQYAEAFETAWGDAQEMAGIDRGGDDSVDGALASGASSAGIRRDSESDVLRPVGAGLQRQMTIEVERHSCATLDELIRALPPDDMRRMAWLNVDKSSSVWVTTIPNSTDRLTSAEFREVAARYYGEPSPACAPFVGMRIGNGTVDKYGFAVASETLPGDGWRRAHDVLKWRIANDGREMGQRPVTEVYGLFAAGIPQKARLELAKTPARKRHGLVPDFMMTLKQPPSPPEDQLLELKTVNLARSHYRFSDNYGEKETKIPIKRRSAQIPREYVQKAQKADQTYCGTSPGTVGPIEQVLRSRFDHVIPLVFGAFGEVNDGVEELIKQLAELGAVIHWRRMKAREPEEAVGALSWMLRRRWGITAVREAARLTLGRLRFAGANPRNSDIEPQSSAHAEARSYARMEALDYARIGPSIGDTRPPAAVRWQ